MVVGRFAPSPSGVLHEGNLATALLSWLDARLRKGKFIIRIDDLDQVRCRQEFTTSNLLDLERLGIEWDAVDYQSQHIAEYEHYIEELKSYGLTYSCQCSRSDTLSFDDKGRYIGLCRHENIKSESNAIRVIALDECISFQDRFLGKRSENMRDDVGDFIIKRRDGIIAYHLASAVDEHRLGITDVVRGADLIDSTPRQIYLSKHLGLNVPNYAHTPLLIDNDGQKISKRARNTTESIFARKEASQIVADIAGTFGLSDEGTITAPELLASLSYDAFNQALLNISNIKLT